MRRLIILILFVVLFPAIALAREASPQWWSVEFKTGFWMPSDSTTEQFFDKCCNLVYDLSGGLLYQGRYGVEVGVGFLSEDGRAVGSATGGQSSDTFNLFLMPMETNLVWRIDYAQRQIVVPYVKAGADYVFFRENVEGDTTKGLKTGLHATGGLQVSLNWLDSDANLDIDYGINDIYLILETKYGWVNSFGSGGLDLSGPIYSAGFLVAF